MIIKVIINNNGLFHLIYLDVPSLPVRIICTLLRSRSFSRASSANLDFNNFSSSIRSCSSLSYFNTKSGALLDLILLNLICLELTYSSNVLIFNGLV